MRNIIHHSFLSSTGVMGYILTAGLNLHRFNVWEDIAYSPDVKHLVFVAKTEQIEPGWRLVRMLTPKGKDSGATLLVKFEFMDLFTL